MKTWFSLTSGSKIQDTLLSSEFLTEKVEELLALLNFSLVECVISKVSQGLEAKLSS